jgi:anti-sigma B factor antagonist
MDIAERLKNDITVFVLGGRIDTQGAVEMDQALQAAVAEGKYKMVLDMATVRYISSAGLRTLADILTKNKRNGGDLKLAALSPRVRRVLEIIGFDNFFSISSTVQQALDEFN